MTGRFHDALTVLFVWTPELLRRLADRLREWAFDLLWSARDLEKMADDLENGHGNEAT